LSSSLADISIAQINLFASSTVKDVTNIIVVNQALWHEEEEKESMAQTALQE
jgi:hypothetical protein